MDLLILGGGCAGLSLAMQLAQHGQRAPSALIVEQRACYENDRTWCFWGDAQTPFASLAARQWSTFKVMHGAQEKRIDCAATPYRMLHAEQFYKAATSALAQAPQIQLKMSSTLAFEPEFRLGRWHGETQDGAFSARSVVDTRPQQPPAQGEPLMWQSFYGLEIECSQAVFEPHCVELMDFQTAGSERVGFTYVLPLTTTRALVEFTVFAAAPFSVEALTTDLQSAIDKRVKGAGFKVLRSENGMLPMGLSQLPVAVKSSPPAYVRAGLFAGAARPATGYAFQRIQRWAADCSRAIVKGDSPVSHSPEPVLRGLMDTLFLNVLRRRPELGPQLFMALFSGVASPRVIRFLGESGRLSDLAAMVWALPPKPFLQQLFKWPHRS